MLQSFLPAAFRRMREGNVFTRVCLFKRLGWGWGIPILAGGWAVCTPWFCHWSCPWSCRVGGTPHQEWGIPSQDRVPLVLSLVLPEDYAKPGQGYPQVRIIRCQVYSALEDIITFPPTAQDQDVYEARAVCLLCSSRRTFLL